MKRGMACRPPALAAAAAAAPEKDTAARPSSSRSIDLRGSKLLLKATSVKRLRPEAKPLLGTPNPAPTLLAK